MGQKARESEKRIVPIKVKNAVIGEGDLVIIAGPCVIESEDLNLQVAEELKKISERTGLPLIYKSSYDKANRTSIDSYRGPGLEEGLRILEKVKNSAELPVLSDVHQVTEVRPAAEVLDVLQIPAFLCRQTDLVVEAAKTGKPVNVKKGQFMAPQDMVHVARKAESTGNSRIMLTERGTFFGYGNLVVDMRSLAIMRSFGHPVVFDCTHSVQLPGGLGGATGGQREFIPLLARAATAAGVDVLFFEVHPRPDYALCDGPNSWPLDSFESLLRLLKRIYYTVRERRVESVL